jgi:hypothetical protein
MSVPDGVYNFGSSKQTRHYLNTPKHLLSSPEPSRSSTWQALSTGSSGSKSFAYPGSPIVEGTGERFFGDSLRGGHGILSRFLLVVDRTAEPAARQAAEQLSESFKNILELRSRPGDTMLVRPDGYIAYTAKDRRDLSSFATIRSVLERQTSGPARKAA